MAKNSVADWSTTAEANTDVAGFNISTGSLARDLNNANRNIMAQVKAKFDSVDANIDGKQPLSSNLTEYATVNPTASALSLLGELSPGQLAAIEDIDAAVAATAADAIATAADALATAADVAQTNANVSATGADVIQTGLDVASTAADVILVEAARDAVLLAGAHDIYKDTTDFLAATVDGDFRVVASSGSWALYENVSGVATKVSGDYPSLGALNAGITLGGITQISALEVGTGIVTYNGAAKVGSMTDAPPGWLWAVYGEDGSVSHGVTDTGVFLLPGGSVTEIDHTVDFAFSEAGRDPSNELAITWVSSDAARDVMEYRLVGAATWQAARSRRTRTFTNYSPARTLHTVLLGGLDPASVYEFRVPGALFTDTFRTTPQRNVVLGFLQDYQNTVFGAGSYLDTFGARFVATGADMCIGLGDYWGDDGVIDTTAAGHWHGFLTNFAKYWRKDGALVPTAWLIGNHDAGNPRGVAGGAFQGGTGLMGHLAELCSFGYDFDHPTYSGKQGVSSFRIGTDLAFIGLDTDHVNSLASQSGFFAAKLAELAPLVRHVVIGSHASAFISSQFVGWDQITTQARTMRNTFWPIMQGYASKIRMVVSGHEHYLSDSGKKSMRYDSSQSLAVNDLRYETGDADGVRQIVLPTIADTRFDFNPALATQVSSLDGSQRLIAAMGYNGSAYTLHGTGITNPNNDTRGIGIAEFTETNWRLRVYGTSAQVFYDLTEAV